MTHHREQAYRLAVIARVDHHRPFALDCDERGSTRGTPASQSAWRRRMAQLAVPYSYVPGILPTISRRSSVWWRASWLDVTWRRFRFESDCFCERGGSAGLKTKNPVKYDPNASTRVQYDLCPPITLRHEAGDSHSSRYL
jgi:hypothetical protein